MDGAEREPFASMRVRALCHATEMRERVEQAVLNAVGEVQLDVSRTQGHHGNEIFVIEARSKGSRHAKLLFERLNSSDKQEILDTIDSRIDESCRLFIRLDKQKAFEEEVTLARDDDAIAIRIKVAAFPARKPIAIRNVTEFVVSRVA
ncbi:MAG: hypothetical protein JSV94_00805 [Methanobacteriota archaeon]|nr:MAG: hypothetical protein JSV94_00805 [Euryarchaeota archaeon]